MAFTMLRKVHCIPSIRVFINNGCDYEDINGTFFIKMLGNFKVKEVLKGKNITENDFINCLKTFGKVSLAELEKMDGYDWKQWEIDYIGKEIPEEEKEKTYYNQVPTKGIELEKNKEYLVFLSYNQEDNYYEVDELVYGMMEYDSATDMIKNIDTGEFEKLDRSLFQEHE